MLVVLRVKESPAYLGGVHFLWLNLDRAHFPFLVFTEQT
jgi:hypothetical protein